MEQNRIVIKYYDRRMLLTVDIHTLLNVVFDNYGDSVKIELVEMDDQEKDTSVETIEGIRAIRERFQILEIKSPDGVQRRKDLENLAIAIGTK